MATVTSVGSGKWSDTATWDTAAVPADDDAVVIAAGHSILMDTDLSSYTGLRTLTITGHATTTPGMLYFKDGTDGYLKFRTGTGYGILGSTGDVTYHGRLLANSDGVWGNTGSLTFANKAIIDLQGTAFITATYLDIALYDTEPTNKFVRLYADKATVDSINTTTNVITCTGAHGWSANRCVCVKSSGTLPAPLVADALYYVGSPSGADLKLLFTSSGTEVDITSAGTGTIEIYSGYATYSGVTEVNTLEDVSADTGWTTTDAHDYVFLVNIYPGSPDIQRALQLSAIAAGSITLSSALDSAQNPGARIYLSSRNVSILCNYAASTTTAISGGTGHVLQCEIRCTGGSGGTYYAYALNSGANITVSGVISNFYFGIATATLTHTISGHIVCCNNGLAGTSHTLTSTGSVAGSGGYGVQGNLNTYSGDIIGGSYAVNGVMFNITPSGRVFGCFRGLVGLYYSKCEGKIFSNTYGIQSGVINLLMTGELFGNGGDVYGSFSFIKLRNCKLASGSATIFVNSRNTGSGYGSYGGVYIENFDRGAEQKAYHCFGDLIKTACDGTGDAPSEDPDGGEGYCIEASNIQSYCNSYGKLPIIEEHRVWLTAAEHTVTYKLQTTYSSISAGNLKLTCWYIGTNGVLTETTNAPAISTRSDDTDWSQTLAVTFTPSAEGWATFGIDLMEYEAGNEVYVWPVPTIT